MAEDEISADYALSFVETEFGLPDGEGVFSERKATTNFKFEKMPRSFEKKQHHALSLEMRMQVLKDSEAGLSHRQLAAKYQCGKTQIGTIVKQKDELLKEWNNNAHRGRKRKRAEPYEELNEMVWKWFQKAKTRQIPINGPILQAKAKEYAYLLEVPTFSASNGWLDSFRRRHNISFRKMKSKRSNYDVDEFDNWKSGIASILNDYSPRDIYSFHETGLLFQSIPNEILLCKSKMSEGGNLAGERLTVALCCNAVGEKENPLVISSRHMPWCLKATDVEELGVKWYRNQKAWITEKMFTRFLDTLNEKMKLENRKIVLFTTDVPCHQSATERSHILVKFLPSCSTTVAQPFDLGIICSFKLLYRKKLLKTLVSRVGGSASINEVAKQINVLQAVKWIACSWQTVKPELITKCFKICGIMSDYRSMVRNVTDYDPEFLSLCELAGISNIEINESVQCFDIENFKEHFHQNIVNPPNRDGSLENNDSSDDEKIDICHEPFPSEKSLNLISNLRGIFHRHCSAGNRFQILNAVDLIEGELEDIIIKKKLTDNLKENS